MSGELNAHQIKGLMERSTGYLLLLNPLALHVCLASYAVLIANKISVTPPVLLVFLVGCWYSIKFYEGHAGLLKMERDNLNNTDGFYSTAKKLAASIDGIISIAFFGFFTVICDLTYAVTR